MYGPAIAGEIDTGHETMSVQEATSQSVPQVGTVSRAIGNGAEDPAAAKERVDDNPGRKSRAQAINVQNLPGGGSSSRARLNFDPEKHRVFVEIVDPETGDVITRFPPEQIAANIDKILEQADQGTNPEDAGLIVDQKV